MANAPSLKRLQIDKTATQIVIYVSIAAFIVVFSLVATKTLVSQARYQNRVIDAKRTAVNQLKANINSTNQLKASYDAFVSTPQNAIGGLSTGTGPRDGNNATIVLDALPSTYDFPGLTTNLETLLTGEGVKIDSISGTDDEIAQSGNQTSSTPQPVAMPFEISVTGDYASIQKVVESFQNSIRPIQIQTMTISGSENLTLTITAQTYYQPATTLQIKTEVQR